MIILTDYHIYNKENFYYVISPEIHRCPICHGPLTVRDSKMRKVIYSETEVRHFRFRRLKCKNCGRLHTELPDFVAPYKHYSREIIEATLHDRATCCPAENSTIYRWNKAFK